MSTVRALQALALLCASDIAGAFMPAPMISSGPPAVPTQASITMTAPACPPSEGAELELALAETLNSARVKRGDRFRLTLAEPLLTSEGTVPAGAYGVGEVVHAEPSRGGGKPGEILLAARYLEYQGEQIKLRGFKLGGSGQDRSKTAIGTAIAAGPFAYFIKGREIELPVGTRARARLAQALPPSVAAAQSASPPCATAQAAPPESPRTTPITRPTE